MRCEQCLESFTQGRLRRALANLHRRRCASCAAEFAQWEHWQRELRTITPPTDMERRLWISAMATEAVAVRPSAALRPRFALAALLLVLCTFAGLYVAKRPRLAQIERPAVVDASPTAEVAQDPTGSPLYFAAELADLDALFAQLQADLEQLKERAAQLELQRAATAMLQESARPFSVRTNADLGQPQASAQGRSRFRG